MSETSGVLRLSALWQSEVGRRAGRLMLGLFVLAVMGAAHVARRGTLPARIVAGAVIGAVVVAASARRMRERRALRTPEGVIRRTLKRADPALAGKALRAHALVEETARDPEAGSGELALLHFRRTLERAPLDSVRRVAQAHAGRLSFALLAVVLAIGAAVLPWPMRVVEGLDVLAARHGVAPLPLAWLNLVRVSAQLPTYLRGGEQLLFPMMASPLPEGSVVSVRGVPERAGRSLILTDGSKEVGFVEDGSGGVVARWKLEKNVRLRVAARFGSVRIPEADELELIAVPDEAPQIELEDAPRTVALREVETVDFHYVASDDHGLKEIDLVLRSGGREERRTLVKLDGQSRSERGAHALSARDAVLRRMFLPVVATIEARDNDVARSGKWGQSAPVTIVPPAVGEPQALRFRALTAAEDKLLDLLDEQLETERLKRRRQLGNTLPERTRREKQLRTDALAELRKATSAVYAGARVSSGLSAFVLGQARALESAAMDRRRSEDVVLAYDAALRALATRDAAEVSRRLGDVAEEAAEGAKLAGFGERQRSGRERLDAALTALDAGSGNLVSLGALGADIGSVAQGEIRRIRRAVAAHSYSDAELAARHLAARLRRPSPSFSSAGGGGVEAGRGAQGPGEPSEADRQFDQLMRELEQLAAEHAQQISSVEGVLEDSEQVSDDEALKREAAERAARLRDALSQLPEPGAPPGSARAAAALAREHMSAMAQNLERLAVKDSVESGQRAQGQLDQAEQESRDPRSYGDWLDRGALSKAARELSEQLKWAEHALEQQRERGAERSAGALGDLSDREENLARRAGNLRGRGEHSEAQLSGDVQESLEDAETAMRQAARELREGHGEQGLERQREAQRLLERANPGRTSDPDDEGRQSSQNDGSQGGDLSTRARVPPADKAQRAADFRRRVLEGLAQERRGRLGGAVERYAEGLLE